MKHLKALSNHFLRHKQPLIQEPPRPESSKVVFLQPSYTHYREELFTILSERHGTVFLFEAVHDVREEDLLRGREFQSIFFDKNSWLKWVRLIYHLIKLRPAIVISSVSTAYRTIISFLYTRVFRKHFILWIEEWREPVYRGFRLRSFGGNLKKAMGKTIIRKCEAVVAGGTKARTYAMSLGRMDGIFTAMQCSTDQRKMIASDSTVGDRSRNTHIFLYLGRLIPLKGLDRLIRSFALLREERDDVLLLIGGDGPFRAYCENLADELKAKDITFLGPVAPSKTHEIYRQADVFVLPSYFLDNWYEGWGLVINEAMSMGLPVIATTAVGAAYDMVIDGHNGFVVQENDVAALYNAMRLILRSDLGKMGIHSRILFEEKNDFTKMADGFTKAIQYVESNNSCAK